MRATAIGGAAHGNVIAARIKNFPFVDRFISSAVAKPRANAPRTLEIAYFKVTANE
jgi:hypothetical protein